MKKLIIILLSLYMGMAYAQEDISYLKKNHFFGLNVAVAKNEFSPSVYWIKQHAFGAKKRFRAGYGLRFTSYFGSKVPYQTAPAKYTSGQTGPQVLFVENIPGNIDTLQFHKSQVNSLNLSINLEYQVYKKFTLAFNIDAVGLTFGNDQSAYHSSRSFSSNARPTALNLLLVSDNDIGSLNSEFLVKYDVNKRFTLVGGFCFLFTEYTTDQKFKLGNDRFRNKSEMFTLGIMYTPFRTY